MGKGCFGPKLYKKNIILSQATCPIAPGQASRVYIEEGFGTKILCTVGLNQPYWACRSGLKILRGLLRSMHLQRLETEAT